MSRRKSRRLSLHIRSLRDLGTGICNEVDSPSRTTCPRTFHFRPHTVGLALYDFSFRVLQLKLVLALLGVPPFTGGGATRRLGAFCGQLDVELQRNSRQEGNEPMSAYPWRTAMVTRLRMRCASCATIRHILKKSFFPTVGSAVLYYALPHWCGLLRASRPCELHHSCTSVSLALFSPRLCLSAPSPRAARGTLGSASEWRALATTGRAGKGQPTRAASCCNRPWTQACFPSFVALS